MMARFSGKSALPALFSFLALLFLAPSVRAGDDGGRSAHLRTALDPQIKVTKVHEVQNDEAYRPHHNDALAFEKQYWSYGAIDAAQKEAARGQIYVVSWRNAGRADRFVTRFEYRQSHTQDEVKVQTVEHPMVSGNARSIFKVTGAAYRHDGPVEAWRFTVLRNNQIVAEEKSFIW